jgi:glycosyltransferase involved in cell wall biosynthesis
MRITIAQGAFFPVPPILGGAVEKTWHVLGQAFAAAGHEVTHLSRRHRSLPKRELRDGVHHIRVRGFNAVRNPLLLKALDLIYSLRVRRALPEADIFVTNTFWLPLLVRDPRQGAVYVHVARMPKGQMRFYKNAARLQGISEAVSAAIAEEAPMLRRKVITLPIPLPWAAAETPSEPARTILYLGRIHPEKGIELLLQAADQARDALAGWRIHIVGPAEIRFGGGGMDYLRKLRAFAEEAALPVTWMGATFEPAHLRQEYRGAALFVYPSVAERGETFGLSALEAMSCGCPPLVSDLACFRDFIRPGENGAVFDHRAADPAAKLAQELARLVSDAPLRAELAKNALATAREYEVSQVAQRYLADFAAVLRARSGWSNHGTALASHERSGD